MKIERVNDNTIRCTLTTEELISRQIRLSELCYGTDKIKALFRDMMIQARNDLGFEIKNVPLMIEAVPLPDSLVLVITKVEDPEELDTRFSRFSPGGDALLPPPDFAGADSMLNLFNKLKDAHRLLTDGDQAGDQDAKRPHEKAGKAPKDSYPGGHKRQEGPAPDVPIDMIRAFRFRSLDDLIHVAHIIGSFEGENALFKIDAATPYQLTVHSLGTDPEEFNRVCNILTEYAVPAVCSPAGEACLAEHDCALIEKSALENLARL
ncbi:MAG: adaptor protein MecA [Eubacterium sp.]|nr:adaptor protein MecA [Eubacterium sp.]